MSRTDVVERVVSAVAGLAALAGGGALVAWWAGVLPSRFGDRVDTAGVAVEDGPAWLVWALLAGAVVGLLLALWWLVARLPMRRRTTVRLAGSGPAGALRFDLGSLATVIGASVEDEGHLESVRTSASTGRRGLVLEVRGVLAEAADPHELEAHVAVLGEDLRRALPDEPAHLRVVVDPPGRSARRRTRRVGRDRVRLPAGVG